MPSHRRCVVDHRDLAVLYVQAERRAKRFYVALRVVYRDKDEEPW